MICAREGRWFATQQGVHRLLTQERRRELQPALEAYQRVRRDEGWRAERGLPDVPADHPHAAIWRRRARHFARARSLARERLGRGPWRVLDVGAGCGWASARLLADGHRVAAVDVSLDEQDGLLAAGALIDDPSQLPRAEADMEALPLEPASMDFVLAAGVLHHAARPARTLVEIRRVTRRGGLVAVLDSPVYRRAVDGETMVAERAEEHARRYGFAPVPFGQGYLRWSELPALFEGAGWRLEVHAWPGRAREVTRDLVEIARWGRRTARFPILIGRRDG
ncbi:MAG TPA: class I SAM-dependent methyltransferase [Vicinamibacteria bacterium]|nr:class I SAM-dependent methyltransferase [Vicinamibacteria bacterium]